MAYYSHTPEFRDYGGSVMAEKTCAACDYKLGDNAIKVNIGGKAIEVCCEECAQKLKEAHASAAGAHRS
jgi:hypothetical protein